MTDFGFRLLVFASAAATLGAILADELGAKGLPEPLRVARERAKQTVVAASKNRPVLAVLRITMVIGYFAALVALALFIPGSALVYLFLSVCWTLLSLIDAPHVLSKPYVLFYELALLLNGATLALCFASPLSVRFMVN